MGEVYCWIMHYAFKEYCGRYVHARKQHNKEERHKAAGRSVTNFMNVKKPNADIALLYILKSQPLFLHHT
jgi:hypothetical protein